MKEIDQEKANRLREVLTRLQEIGLVGSQRQFATLIRVNHSHMADMLNGKKVITNFTLSKVINKIPFVSREYLEQGIGEMFNAPPNMQNIYSSHAHGTQIIGDSKTTNNYGETCKANNQVIQTSKLLETHEKAIDEIVKLTKIIASQQETIDKLISQHK